MPPITNNQPSSFQKSLQSNQFLIPSLPFSIWDGNTLVWASDECHARKITPSTRALMISKTFVMNEKRYTVLSDAQNEAQAELMVKALQASVSGTKDRNAVPLLSFYHLCRNFFSGELSTHMLFSQKNLTPNTLLECGIPFMFAFLLTIYPILCKQPASHIDLQFEVHEENSSITMTPHCEFDLQKDVLCGDFISELLKATLKNADFSLIEKQNEQGKSLVLSSKHTTRVVTSATFKAIPDFEVYSAFAFFISLYAQHKDTSL